MNVTQAAIIIAGPPCTGKTSIGNELGRVLDATVLSMDYVRAMVLPGSDHTRQNRDLAYRVMHFTGSVLNHAGKKVILDATYQRFEMRSDAGHFLAEGSPSVLIQCKCDEELALCRYRSRIGHPATNLSESEVRAQLREYRFSSEGITIDTASPLQLLMDIVRSYLKSGAQLNFARWADANSITKESTPVWRGSDTVDQG